MALFLIGHLAHAVVIPNGWDDVPYVEFGKQNQTNLLYLRVFGTNSDTGQWVGSKFLSAAYLNGRFAITAGHALAGFPAGSQITAEVSTGPHTTTNRGTVTTVAKVIVYPTYDYLNPPDPRIGYYVPDVAILCLTSNLAGPQVTITNAEVGEIVTEAGFGYHGSAATGLALDGNSRAWNAPVDSTLGSAFSPDY